MLTSRITMGVLAVTAVAVSGCGGNQKFVNRPRPPLPVNLTVYINDFKVSVSPAAVGAGPVIFQVTNNASRAESVAIVRSSGGGQALASTGPISPQASAQVSVNLRVGGDYMVTTASGGSTDASLAAPASIQPGVVHVGAPRATSHNELMVP